MAGAGSRNPRLIPVLEDPVDRLLRRLVGGVDPQADRRRLGEPFVESANRIDQRTVGSPGIVGSGAARDLSFGDRLDARTQHHESTPTRDTIELVDHRRAVGVNLAEPVH